jgi:hypothetical protein
MSGKIKREEPSLERGKFRSKGLKEGDDDVRVFFKEPHNVRGKDRLLCFVSEHTVSLPRAEHSRIPGRMNPRAAPCCSRRRHSLLSRSARCLVLCDGWLARTLGPEGIEKRPANWTAGLLACSATRSWSSTMMPSGT